MGFPMVFPLSLRSLLRPAHLLPAFTAATSGDAFQDLLALLREAKHLRTRQCAKMCPVCLLSDVFEVPMCRRRLMIFASKPLGLCCGTHWSYVDLSFISLISVYCPNISYHDKETIRVKPISRTRGIATYSPGTKRTPTEPSFLLDQKETSSLEFESRKTQMNRPTTYGCGLKEANFHHNYQKQAPKTRNIEWNQRKGLT